GARSSPPGAMPIRNSASATSRLGASRAADSGRAGRDHRPRRYQLLPERIHFEIESFEGMGAEQGEVSRLREDDEIRGFGAAGPNQRITDVALEAPAIGDDEGQGPLRADPERLQHLTRYP